MSRHMSHAWRFGEFGEGVQSVRDRTHDYVCQVSHGRWCSPVRACVRASERASVRVSVRVFMCAD